MCSNDELKDEIDSLRDEFVKFKDDTDKSIRLFAGQLETIESGQKEMLEVFHAGTGVLSFIKLLASIAASLTAIGAFWFMITNWSGWKG